VGVRRAHLVVFLIVADIMIVFKILLLLISLFKIFILSSSKLIDELYEVLKEYLSYEQLLGIQSLVIMDGVIELICVLWMFI
jgi:hypothetical protein